MKKIKQLHLTFQLPLYHRQIPQWRGAIIEWAGLENDLFHNHKTGKQHYYRYPLIQYGVDHGQASILAINEGADQLEQLLSQKDWQINWQGQPVSLEADQARLDWPSVQLSDKLHRYQLQHWLPLNQENYRWWMEEASSLQERVTKLESILLSNLLTFATGIQWQVPDQIKVAIQNIRRTKKLRFHGTPMIALDISFDSNLILPDNIRLGRAVSHGFGELKPIFKAVKKQHKSVEQFKQKQLI
jgi:hypothetical protein